ncbi:MAG: MaoC family dehydratase [Leptospiraceae bacterium]|nr:MaoC family dehydratase [Leptospiraceae bacterium]
MNIGDKFKEIFKISQNEVNLYSELSKDKNPIHFDEVYAKKTHFERPIVHGLFLASRISKILGNNFPGEGTIYRKQTLSFSLPAYVETDYTIEIKILDIDKNKGSALLSTLIKDEHENIIISGEAVVYHNIFKD